VLKCARAVLPHSSGGPEMQFDFASFFGQEA